MQLDQVSCKKKLLQTFLKTHPQVQNILINTCRDWITQHLYHGVDIVISNMHLCDPIYTLINITINLWCKHILSLIKGIFGLSSHHRLYCRTCTLCRLKLSVWSVQDRYIRKTRLFQFLGIASQTITNIKQQNYTMFTSEIYRCTTNQTSYNVIINNNIQK